METHYIDAISEVQGKIQKIKLFQNYQGVLISQNQPTCINIIWKLHECTYISAKLQTVFLLKVQKCDFPMDFFHSFFPPSFF